MAEKMQRYTVQASQEDVYYFFPYTEDEKEIERNIEAAWQNCFIADYGRISGVLVQNPTGTFTSEQETIYAGDFLVYNEHIYKVVEKEGGFHLVCQEEDNTEEIPLDPSAIYAHYREEEPYDDFYNEDTCGCCPCCGCTCEDT